MTDDLERRRESPETVGIEDVDCTPRPRWRETQVAFEARMRRLGAEHAGLVRAVNRDNRNAALRGVTADGTVIRVDGPVGAQYAAQFFTQCACSWHGLTHADPELARREYDAHPCTANDGDAIHREYRGPIDRRPQSTMVEGRGDKVDVIESYRLGPNRELLDHKIETVDDFEQRVKLLETK